MQFLAHRGFWFDSSGKVLEKNSLASMRRAFDCGFGIEIDLRDAAGRIVVSHDLPDGTEYPFEEVLKIYPAEKNLLMALNIKSDGLQAELATLLRRYNIRSFFVFDMSIPDTIGYMREGVRYYTRQSEYEPEPALYEQANGVWVDIFLQDWPESGVLERHLNSNKAVCLVSPELHRREQYDFWDKIKGSGLIERFPETLSLCTDYPEEAQRFFNT